VSVTYIKYKYIVILIAMLARCDTAQLYNSVQLSSARDGVELGYEEGAKIKVILAIRTAADVTGFTRF
jgi:hypothetical protein